ncbi:probable WRKY transcription factor 70 [Cynara cardunculus var. scolymus]|uniref:probable WRKY transcription factor 70 n=1 Tax=Cynara cardunculus var. scolymus TaxID=59895 RepID=UPI000D62926E|nr:probable WRKY transcription factor 70 [Cynara cardunculus var. scolymus]
MERNKKKLVETLTRGRNSAMRLQNLLRQKVHDDGLVSVDDLVTEISRSFSGSLLVLNSCNSGKFCGVPVNPHLGLACSLNRVPEVYSGNTAKNPAQTTKERRGCYKRRKTIDSWIEISGRIEDGHAWRKYGQKKILDSKFPRCYFRCTHKYVHGCKALKQVQKLEDESNKFHITYFGHHTCQTPNASSHPGVVLDSKDFTNHCYLPSSPSTITSIQIDPSFGKEDPSDNVSSGNDAQSSPPLLWKEILVNDLDIFKKDYVLTAISFDDALYF